MALWQFTLDPIPASSARVKEVDAIRLSRGQLDAIEVPVSAGDLLTLCSSLSQLLPEKKAWAPALRIWGDEKSDDVQIWFDGDTVDSVQFRLDVSRLSLSLVGGLCELARKFRWVFATRDGAIFQPTREAVMRAVMQSAASRFVQDPKGYLEEAIRADRETR